MSYSDVSGTLIQNGTMDSSEQHLRLVRSLFPELASHIDSAYEAAVEDTGQNAHSVEASFDSWLDGEVETLRRSDFGEASFGSVSQGDARSRLAQAFSAARQAAHLLRVAVPLPEAFAAAGADFAQLAASLEADSSLTPVPAPYGLGAARWKEAFNRTNIQAEKPETIVAGKVTELYLATEVEREFSILDSAPDATSEHTLVDDRHVHWTLRLIPAADQPAVLGFAFAHGPHVTLPEMLMLQLMRVADGLDPVDAGTFTWIDGALADGRLAARHVYDVNERAIRLSSREPGNQGPHMGARPPQG